MKASAVAVSATSVAPTPPAQQLTQVVFDNFLDTSARIKTIEGSVSTLSSNQDSMLAILRNIDTNTKSSNNKRNNSHNTRNSSHDSSHREQAYRDSRYRREASEPRRSRRSDSQYNRASASHEQHDYRDPTPSRRNDHEEHRDRARPNNTPRRSPSPLLREDYDTPTADHSAATSLEPEYRIPISVPPPPTDVSSSGHSCSKAASSCRSFASISGTDH